MMLGDLARALDPARVAADCGVTLDSWQADVVRSQDQRLILLCARQTGKTLTTAFKAVATAVLKSGALILILSPSQRQSSEMFRVVLGLLKKLKDGPAIVAESALRCELENKSRIVALPSSETTIRGYSAADLIICDEAARIPDELFAAVRPMLATSGGCLVMLSTPAGRRGQFFETWQNENDWQKVKVAATDCPRISKEFLDSELAELGQKQFESEYGLIFHDSDEAMFASAAIEAAFSPEVQPLWH
jgi:hypothetical protein